jgi:hypothetical protein
MTDLPRLGSTPLADWIANAQVDDVVIVQTLPHNRNPEVAAARNAGLITTFQRRANDHAFHLIAKRTSPPSRPDKAPLGRGSISAPLARQRGPRPETVERIRQALDLRDKGMKRTEIADALGITPDAVKNLMRRAREEGMIE